MKKRTSLTWVAGAKTPMKTYITRVVNFGTLEEWQEMKRTVPRKQILEAVEHPLRGQWTPRGKSFAECVFDRKLPEDCLISYEC